MKQRLVGILVVGCLAVIIIPILLDGEGIKAPPLSTTIPPEPEFPTTVIPEPTRPAIVADTLPQPDADAATAEPAAEISNQPELAVNEEEAAADPALPAYESAPEPAADEPDARPANDEPDALEAAVAAILADNDSQQASSADSTPRLDSSGLPAAFVVRLGSFGEKANAESLVSQLLAADYKAYSRSVNTANGVFNAVYVGPVITKAEANDLVDDLSARFQLKGIVENFTMQPLQ
jgi:DedD protein